MNLENKVRVVPHVRESAAMNLAREEALFIKAREMLKRTGEFQPVIGVYSFEKPCVVLGNDQTISDINLNYCEENGIEVTMRKSGGGSVYLSPEEIQYFYILPKNYSRELVKNINRRIQAGLGDVGLSPQLRLINGSHVLRIDNDQSFVFDAQKGSIVFNEGGVSPRYITLHHGTILIDDKDFGHMPAALKAPEHIAVKLKTGNTYLRQKKEIRERELINSLLKNLPFDSETVVRDLSSEEIKLANNLHDEYYSDREKFSNGKIATGICYIPGPDYDMEKYRTEEVIV